MRKLVVGLAWLGLPCLMAGCEKQASRRPADVASAGAETGSDLALVPDVVALEPVGRAELLEAADAAADKVAAGNDLPSSNLRLTNRSFELRLPFACGDGAIGNWGEWTFDPKTNVLRVIFRPQSWSKDPSFRAAAGVTAYDAAEGFWIERPWTRSEQCPPVPEVASAPRVTPNSALSPSVQTAAPAAQTLALVQYFSPDAPRTMRRGNRAYTYTAKMPADDTSTARSFRARVTGRIVGFADGQPVHCVLRDPSHPPLCMVAVEFTQVILEDAVTGEGLADWGR